jgi:hypothetical protein
MLLLLRCGLSTILPVRYGRTRGSGNIAVRSYIQMRELVDNTSASIFSGALGMLTGIQKTEGDPVKLLESSSRVIELKIWQDLMIKLRGAIG